MMHVVAELRAQADAMMRKGGVRAKETALLYTLAGRFQSEVL
jgi:hypothetical protein